MSIQGKWPDGGPVPTMEMLLNLLTTEPSALGPLVLHTNL